MSRFLERFAEFINENGYNTFRIAEIYNGGEPESMTLRPSSSCLNTYSISKAFSVTAIGILYDRGLISLDEHITDILKDECPENMDLRWNKLTVDMTMRHLCGLPLGFLDIDVQDIKSYGDDDFLRYMLGTRLECEPGEKWSYSDGAFYLISRVVTKKTGRILDEFLWRELFLPLGFQEAAWSKCPKGYPIGGSGLYIRAEDMVKLGALYLNGGIYNGKRILSKEWTDITLEKGYELGKTGVGESFGKGGYAAQMLLVIPETGRVAGWQSFDLEKDQMPLIRFAAEYRD